MKLRTASAPEMREVALADYNSKTELTCNVNVQNSYVPAEHRTTELTSSSGALAHLLKASLGSGVLAMPLAFRNAGLAVGSVGTVLVGVVCTHSLHMLVRISQEICVETRTPALSYAETCHKVFQMGPAATRGLADLVSGVANWALAATHAGACCVYVVLISESFNQITNYYDPHHEVVGWSVTTFCWLCLVPLVPLTQITKLKYLVPFSALANLVWTASICISLYYCYADAPALSERKAATDIYSLPLFICNALFAMEGVGIIMPVENEMARPEQFLGCPGVLNTAMVFVVMLYGFVGFSGYLKYGDEVQGSLTLNLPQDELLAQSAKILVALVLMLSFSLIFYVPVDVMWRKIQFRLDKTRHNLYMALLRLVGVLIIVGLAAAIPRLELFMELVGAICLSVMGLLLPATIDTVWRWNGCLGAGMWRLWKNLLIALVAVLTLVFGSYYAIKGLIEYLSSW